MPNLFKVLTILFLMTACTQNEVKYTNIVGQTFGTSFSIKYKDEKGINYQKEIKQLFDDLNHSMSTYHDDSLISDLNKSIAIDSIDDYFKSVVDLSKTVHKQTDGYFDPTVGQLVDIWGFGKNNHKEKPSKKVLDSVMDYIGFDKIYFKEKGLVKTHKNVKLNFNAVAKGYGVDVVANFFDIKGIKNYMVEIGGEVRVKGVNKKQKLWTVGIEEPNYDGSRSLQKVICLNNEAIATSGNYRKYKTDTDGQKYGHTLNPFTGASAKTDLLSVSVISNKGCGYVDAFATGMMAMGFEKAKEVAKKQELKVFFIYVDESNKMKMYSTVENNL